MEEYTKGIIGKRLRYLREKHGQEVSKVCNSLDIAYPTYKAWENGHKNPKPEALRELANYYNTTTDFLLGLTNAEEPIIDKLNMKKLLTTKKIDNVDLNEVTLMWGNHEITAAEAQQLNDLLEVFLRDKTKK